MKEFSHLTDDELVTMYADGCNEAFDALLLRYKDPLFNYIFFRINKQELADDVFQETFVKAIVHIKDGRYSCHGHFFPWLTRIAHNIIMDQFRVESQMPVVSAEANDGCVMNSAAIIDTYHEEQLINEQTLKDVHRLMMHLPESQRKVVEMRYYQNLSFKEIAEMTGVSVNTSLGRMRYALQNMRRMAKENGISLEWM